ncbi:MAG: hypothetical protein IKH59_05905 [Bacteroidaceae bacterium]|nr:hypothetical protein [Bacteroidaceae bacterium]
MNRFLISIIVGLIVSLSVAAFICLKRRKVLSDAFTREKLCFGWAVIVIRSIVYCLPSILVTAVLIVLWKSDFLAYAIGIFFFWVFVPVILVWLYLLFRSRKVLTWNHLVVIGINVFNLVFFVMYLLIERPHHVCNPEIMETYYEAHKADLDSLSRYANSILDDSCSFELEFENGKVAIFHAWKNGEGSSNWDVEKSKVKELCDFVGIDKREFRGLKKRLDGLGCISVAASSTTSEPVEIGFRRVMMSGYSFLVYPDSMGNEKYEEYYDSEMYIPYNGRVVFVYGSPAFGDLNFPGKEEYLKTKQ